MSNLETELEEKIKIKLIDNRLSCAQAHQISEELKIPLGKVGEKANQMNVKISKCMLGCF